MITEKNNVFYCDCGFSFERGRSGAHDCGSGLRKKLAESEARCAALAAENAGLAAELQSVKAMNDCLSEELRGYESDGAFEGPKMHLLWWQCETPNHDAFLAEVRASELDSLAGVAETMLVKFANQGASEIPEAKSWELVRRQASHRATQLRKGVQS
ncbi:hypothetical protein [Enterobacter sp. Crenshaw]|uniref:hypothetical protein n=1 Tax=Enterobacter sp. Crenshaw TaxID=1977566 RepID=UPI000C78A595|nr:hypothetical protein [Enterobacter sp. Crenshaw]AUM03229.1 hypothetical protein B7P19_08535 [Enterobacter sp. Crenshaw]UVH64890.1 hypothetical protein NWV12_08425 [Enterobacter sp. Crenshaw]